MKILDTSKGYASDSTLAITSCRKVQRAKSNDSLLRNRKCTRVCDSTSNCKIPKNNSKVKRQVSMENTMSGQDLDFSQTSEVPDRFMLSRKLARSNAMRRERQRLYRSRVAAQRTELTTSHRPQKLNLTHRDSHITRCSTVRKSKRKSFKNHQVSIRCKRDRSDVEPNIDRNILSQSYCIVDTKCLFNRLQGLNRCHSFSSLRGVGDHAAPMPSPPPGMKWVVYGFI